MKHFIYSYQDGTSFDDFSQEVVVASNRDLADKLFFEKIKSWDETLLDDEISKYLSEDHYLLSVIEIPMVTINKEHLECNPTGRITYRTLRYLLNQMSEFQLDCDVTIEDPLHYVDDPECFAGELTICGSEHSSLDDFHPTIRYLADKDDFMNDEFSKDSNINESINKDGGGE